MSNQAAPSHDTSLTALAIAGFLVASYLALYQLHVFDTVWEPLSGDGSRLILHSRVSRMLPVPDAALGAAGYLAEVVYVSLRRRSPGWVGYAYLALVIVFLLGSLALIALQGAFFHAWCTLCLVSAMISLVIAGIVARDLMGRQGHGRQS